MNELDLIDDKEILVERIILLEEELKLLQTENESLRKDIQNMHQTRHNERGAGRKKTLQDEQIQDVQNDRSKGMTIEQLSVKYGVSTGLIHKVIHDNALNNKDR